MECFMFKLWFDAPCLKYACKINMHLYSREGSGGNNIISYGKHRGGGEKCNMMRVVTKIWVICILHM